LFNQLQVQHCVYDNCPPLARYVW